MLHANAARSLSVSEHFGKLYIKGLIHYYDVYYETYTKYQSTQYFWWWRATSCYDNFMSIAWVEINMGSYSMLHLGWGIFRENNAHPCVLLQFDLGIFQVELLLIPIELFHLFFARKHLWGTTPDTFVLFFRVHNELLNDYLLLHPNILEWFLDITM